MTTAVVPAAGEGTRLRPLTADRPKGLVEVDGTPILTHCFDRFVELGIEECIVVIGYRGRDIVEHYGDSFGSMSITYARQRERRGLAHAIARAGPYVDDAFVVVNGDNVVRANLADLVARQRRDGVEATLLVERVSRETARTTGVVETDASGAVVSMVEKPDEPPSTLVSAGCYAFSPAIFHACSRVAPSERGEYELSDAIDLLVAGGDTVETVPLEGWRVNVNTRADVERAEELLRA